MDDAHLEAVPIQTEVPLDQPHEAIDRGVLADRPAVAALAVSARDPGVEPFTVGPLVDGLERAPVLALEFLEGLCLGHGVAPLSHGIVAQEAERSIRISPVRTTQNRLGPSPDRCACAHGKPAASSAPISAAA